jgi:phage repressor protein C with HTH and peptisase S24 domain
MKSIERIYQYIDSAGLKIAEFERKCGLSNGYLRKMKVRNGDLGEGVLMQIIENSPDLSAEWLLTGNGEMLRSGSVSSVPVAIPAEQGQGIPLIPIEAMAGYGIGDTQVLEYECDHYVVPVFKDAEFLIQVKGSSMIPKYNSGDIVACKKLPLDGLFFQWNKVYVLDTIQGALIKRVKSGSDAQHLLIVSDNANYEPFELHISQIHSVAIVIGVIRLE